MSSTPTIAPARTATEASSYLRGCALLVLGGFVLSLGAFCIRLSDQSDPIVYVFWRSIGFTAALFVVAAVRDHRSPLVQVRSLTLSGWIAAIAFGTSSITFVSALSVATLAEVFFLAALAPLMTALLAWPVLGERIGPLTVLALGMGLAGVYLMTGGELAPEAFTSGTVLALVSAATFAAYSLAVRRSRGDERDATLLAAGVFLLVLTPAAMAAKGLAPLAYPVEVAIAVGHGALITAAGMWLFGQGSRSVPAIVFITLAQVESVLAPVWGFLFFGENPGQGVITGGALILLAVVVQALDGARPGTVRRS